MNPVTTAAARYRQEPTPILEMTTTDIAELSASLSRHECASEVSQNAGVPVERRRLLRFYYLSTGHGLSVLQASTRDWMVRRS